jgi:thiosulfate/3-mercaptopyruvate sulfurtransferase
MEEDEPRPGLRRGQISGSKNLPFLEVIDMKTGQMKSNKDLSRAFLERDVDVNRPALFSCGSGMSACIPALAYAILSEEGDQQL